MKMVLSMSLTGPICACHKTFQVAFQLENLLEKCRGLARYAENTHSTSIRVKIYSFCYVLLDSM